MLIKRFKVFLYSVVLIPIGTPDTFLNLKYSKGIANKVSIDKTITISVDKSASPLFYKMPQAKLIKKLNVLGDITIQKSIDPTKDDSYFQLGIIYAGDYRPNSFVKMFLPEWLKKVLNLNSDYGVGRIDFHEVSMIGRKLNRKDKIRDIKMNFETSSYIKEDNSFTLSVIPREEKVLGFWLRSDGDDSKAKFQTTLKNFRLSID